MPHRMDFRKRCYSVVSERISESMYDYSSAEDDMDSDSEIYYVTGEETKKAVGELSRIPSFGVAAFRTRCPIPRKRDSRRVVSSGSPLDRNKILPGNLISDSSMISDDSGLSSQSSASVPRSSIYRLSNDHSPYRENPDADSLDELEPQQPVGKDNAPIYENCRRPVDYTSVYGNLVVDTFYELLRAGPPGHKKIDCGRKRIQTALKFTAPLQLTDDELLNRERIKKFAKFVERRLSELHSNCLLDFRRGCDEVCSILNRIKIQEEEDPHKSLSSRFTRGIRRVFTINRK